MSDYKNSERDVAGLRILVVGCGSIGSRHISNLCNIQAGDITAYDSDEKLLAKIKSLTSLQIQGTQITQAGIEALKKALPHCKVTQ